MTNEEQAKTLTGFDARLYEMHKEDVWAEDETDREKYEIALEMAEWKDQQFKEYLEKKKVELFNSNCLSVEPFINFIDEIIINDLFPKSEEPNNSDRDE